MIVWVVILVLAAIAVASNIDEQKTHGKDKFIERKEEND